MAFGTAETAHLVTQLDLKDGLSSGLGRAQGQLAGFSKSVGQVGTGHCKIKI